MYCLLDVNIVEMTYSLLMFLKPVEKILNSVHYSIYLRLICPAILVMHCIMYVQLECNGERTFFSPIVPSPGFSRFK
jgi:hypothetical protein